MLDRLNQSVPIRYTTFFVALAGFCLSLLFTVVTGHGLFELFVFALLTGVGVYDLQQKHHSILRNYPILGHMRFMLEFIRPEIRQYFFENETEATPFSRSQRSLVYSRAKGESDKHPFGTDLDVRATGYEWITHSISPSKIESQDFRVKVGGDQCTNPYSISLFNISAMSFGALSANAILALNKGAKLGGFAHDTGEGSISTHHRVHGGDIIWEVASGYFGCRDETGHFSPEQFKKNALDPQVKMIEIKLSQGAKPGHGGVLPASKVTPEIAEARGVPLGVDCVSPSAHSRFSTPLEMMAFVAELRQLSEGKPVGIKLCIGHAWEWFAIVKAMLESKIRPDFIVVDGAEGGTGAAPLEFSDHLGMPLQEALRLVHNTLVGAGLRDQIKIGASGKIISGFDIARALALGADWCNSARGFMFAVGCIQAQTCHTGNCPTGVATQDPVRQIALVVPNKAERVYGFHKHTLEAVKEILEAAGVQKPKDLNLHHIIRRISEHEVKPLSTLFPDLENGILLNLKEKTTLDDKSEKEAQLIQKEIFHIFTEYWPLAQANSFAMKS
jgi:glutamate synthase domain-containing protein 2